MNTETSIYRAALGKGKRLDLEFDENRNPFIYMIKGKAEVNKNIIPMRDQARIRNESSLEIVWTDPSEFILIDGPA